MQLKLYLVLSPPISTPEKISGQIIDTESECIYIYNLEHRPISKCTRSNSKTPMNPARRGSCDGRFRIASLQRCSPHERKNRNHHCFDLNHGFLELHMIRPKFPFSRIHRKLVSLKKYMPTSSTITPVGNRRHGCLILIVGLCF